MVPRDVFIAVYITSNRKHDTFYIERNNAHWNVLFIAVVS